MTRKALGLGLAITLGAALATPRVDAGPEGDLEAVRAANQAFYDAFSAKDLGRMERAWSQQPYVRVLGPRSKEFGSGWEAVRAHWQDVFARFDQIAIAMESPQIEVRDRVAWVSGLERLEGRVAGGQAVSVASLATRVLEKQGDRWLTVHHHGSAQPK